MSQEVWVTVDQYFDDLFAAPDPVMEAVLSAMADLPQMQITAQQGKFLHLIAQIIGAKRILEIGTLGGYSAIWMARALPTDGKLITLEYEAKHAEIARNNFARAGLSALIECRVGAALDSLQALKDEGGEAFDLIFVDADKVNNVNYLNWALKFSRIGTVLIFDNVVRGGAVLEAHSTDPNVQGTRALNDALANEARLSVSALQTVGGKGWDGFAMAVVTS